MQVTIEPGHISGAVSAPPSKSMTQRAYAAALLHEGETIIHNAGHSEDEQAALNIIQQLGAVVEVIDSTGTLRITSDGIKPAADHIDCHESGLAARLFMPIVALANHDIRIQGSGSLLHRPMEGVKETLPQLGAALKDFNGYLPFTVCGPLHAGDITIDASSGSQLLSGLLFALSATRHPATIHVTDLKSKPYIDMTLEMLAQFGRPILHHNYEVFHIDPAKFTQPGKVTIIMEADWSSAAALLIAGAIAGDITVQHLNTRSAQADRVILDVLSQAGAELSVSDDSVSVKQARLQAFEFDATHCPDLFPILAVLASRCRGESYIKGVSRLFHKESNRAESISDMLQNFDVPFSMEDDTLCVTGVRRLQGTVIDSYSDHRIVMAASVAALCAGSRVDIMQAEAVNKSYPTFFSDLAKCDGKCNFS